MTYTIDYLSPTILNRLVGRILSFYASIPCQSCEHLAIAAARVEDGTAPDATPSSRLPRPRSRGMTTDLAKVKAGRVFKQRNRDSTPAVTQGLHNPGNMCYQNAAFQCLIHCPQFVDYLQCSHRPETCTKRKDECIPCTFKDFVTIYLRSRSLRQPTHAIRNAVTDLHDAIKKNVSRDSSLYDDLQQDRQTDSFDFLNCLLAELRADELLADEPKVEDLFQLQHETEWTCQDCGRVSTRIETPGEAGKGEFGTSVDISAPKRSLFLMTTYLRDDSYNQELRLDCESAKCKAHVAAQKARAKARGKRTDDFESKIRNRKRYITSAPEIIPIQLSRFRLEYNPASGDLIQQKISDSVHFEEYLDLGEFTRSKEPLLYRLQAVVAHRGDLQRGHYIASVRDFNGKDFVTLNDEHCIASDRGGTVRELQLPTSFGQEFDPYVLFYCRVHLAPEADDEE